MFDCIKWDNQICFTDSSIWLMIAFDSRFNLIDILKGVIGLELFLSEGVIVFVCAEARAKDAAAAGDVRKVRRWRAIPEGFLWNDENWNYIVGVRGRFVIHIQWMSHLHWNVGIWHSKTNVTKNIKVEIYGGNVKLKCECDTAGINSRLQFWYRISGSVTIHIPILRLYSQWRTALVLQHVRIWNASGDGFMSSILMSH